MALLAAVIGIPVFLVTIPSAVITALKAKWACSSCACLSRFLARGRDPSCNPHLRWARTFVRQAEHAFDQHDYGNCASPLGSWASGHVSQADCAEPLYAAPPLAAAWIVFRRRDVAS